MTRKRKISFIVLVTALTIAVLVVPVMAAPPLDVHIEDEHTIGTNGSQGFGSFIASGPAVNEGLLCETGDVFDLSVSRSGPPGGAFRILRVRKQFGCGDDSGTFDVKLVVRLDLITHYTTANWKVVGGTGDYVGLHANGQLIGIPIDPGVSITDIYDGRVH